MLLSSCEPGVNCLTLFKTVAAVIFVGESDRYSFRYDFNETEHPKTEQSVVMALLRPVWCHGFITI